MLRLKFKYFPSSVIQGTTEHVEKDAKVSQFYDLRVSGKRFLMKKIRVRDFFI